MGCQCKINGEVEVQNFLCVLGDDFYENLVFIDYVTGQNEDVSLWTFTAKIYASYAAKLAGAQPLIVSTNGTGFFIIDGPGGEIGWAIPASLTGVVPVELSPVYGLDVPQNDCVYDIVGTDGNGLEKTVMRGTFTFQLRLS